MEDRDHAREVIENAVFRALEAGMTKKEIREEFEYALENAEDV